MSPALPERHASTGISVLISGAGVAGIAAALEFWRRGCEVRILERTKESSQIGDTFMIGDSALRWLKYWPEMQKRHDEIAYYPLFCKTAHTGKRMMEPQQFSQAMGSGKEPRPKMHQHSRPKFHRLLIEQIEKTGMQIEYGTEVEDYFEDEASKKAGLVLKDGSKIEADLVVAADGLRGKSWGLVAGEPVPARSSGSAVYRVAYPVELAIKDPEVAERFQLAADGSSIFELWVGPGMFGTFWRNDTEMMWSITHPDEGTADESWNSKVDPEVAIAFTKTVPDWPEVANKVIRATPPDALVDWKLMWRDPQPKWTSPGGHGT